MERGRYWIGGVIGVCGLVIGSNVSLGAQVAYTVLPVVAPGVSGQPTPRVTLSVHDSSMAYVLRELVHQAHLRVGFDSSDSLFAKRVTVHVTNEPIMDALATVLRGTGLVATFAADGETVLIRRQGTTPRDRTQGPTGVVSGQVADSASGLGVSGATVSVMGTKLSVLTTESGAFTLQGVPVGNQELAVKVFGYHATSRAADVAEGQTRQVRFVVAPVATVLSGVVTTATGVQSKMSVGSDITTINVDSVMKTAPISTVTDLLENRVPGLTVVHTSGTPGDPSRLLLRGAASVNGNNNPIVVVDGVRVYDPQDLGTVETQFYPYDDYRSAVPRPSPLDQIDPNTIETIEVLKGPSASALYGSDAANGVIVITTKHGQSGQTHWSVSAGQGVSYVPGDYPELTYEFGHAQNNGGETECLAGALLHTSPNYPCIIDSVRTFQALNDSRFSPLTPGPRSNLSATVSGGASALTYSFTGSAQNTHGMTKLPDFSAEQYTEAVGSAPPSWMRRPDDYVGWSGSGQVQAMLSSTASITVSDMLSSSTQHRTNLGLTAVGDLINEYVDTTNIADTPEFSDFFTQITQVTSTSTTNATLNWRIRPWLPLTVTSGYNRTQERDKQYQPAGLPAAILPAASDTTGFYDLGTRQATVATLNANSTMPVAFRHGPSMQLALGANFVSQSFADVDIGTGVVPVGVSDPTTFPQTTSTHVYQVGQSSATYGWFFEPQLRLQSRLFINPGIRLDGGTASGSGAGFSIFPKTNFSYIAIDRTSESGQSGRSQILSLLRLRGAFGIAGVQPTPGQALRLFGTPYAASLNGGSVSGTAIPLTTLGNTLLHPERSREFEVGFDAQFFQNRATLTTTYFNRLRIDAIEAVPLAPSVLGLNSAENDLTTYQNVGNIRNSGVEVTGELRVLAQSAVTWTVNGSISTDRNIVLSTSSSLVQSQAACNQSAANNNFSGVSCLKPGYPIDAKFSPVIVGYGDQNHDGLIERNEIFMSDSNVYIGASDPRFTASFGTILGLWNGRLSFSANGSYTNGMAVRTQLAYSGLVSLANQPGANDEDIVRALVGNTDGTGLGFFTVVNYFRVDAMSVNFTLPTAVAHAFRAQQATLALQGSNLGLWTNYPGKDPGATSAISGLDLIDNGGLPLPRVWQLAVRIVQ